MRPAWSSSPTTRCPGKVPGFVKDLVSKGWVERNFRHAMADFKALVEAEV